MMSGIFFHFSLRVLEISVLGGFGLMEISELAVFDWFVTWQFHFARIPVCTYFNGIFIVSSHFHLRLCTLCTLSTTHPTQGTIHP